nr:LysM peptidoglycan-binding domain-containing protein [Bifidobacterium hapali]
MRQYTSNGRISGYAGPLDLNYFRGDATQWNKYANPNGHTTAPAPTPAPKPNTPAPQPSRPNADNGVSVVVRSGDTISGIAARTGLWPVTAWSVPSGNINRIWPGQTVTYRGSGTPSANTGTGTRIHVVKRGETLSGIFGASGWQRVAQLNNLANPNLIYPGQQLRY